MTFLGIVCSCVVGCAAANRGTAGDPILTTQVPPSPQVAMLANTASPAPTGTMAMPRPTAAAALPRDSAGSPENKPLVVAQSQRVILKNATLSLTVDDPRKTVSQVTLMAESTGGWIVSSNATTTMRDGRDVIQATISVRIPADQFSTFLEHIKAGALSVDEEDITGQDVTNQFVDLTSQLGNLESTEAQLKTVMTKADNISDILTVQSQLTNIQGQIAVIKGQLKYFSEAAAYSLINLTLTQKPEPLTPTPTFTPTATPTITPTPSPKPLGLANWRPGDTAQAAVDSLVALVQIIITGLIWVVGFLLPLVVPVLIVWYVVQRVRSHRPKVQASPSSVAPGK